MRLLALIFLAAPVHADPVFQSVPVPQHLYTGGWEHFVGGGLAAFDCDADGLPELLAAGGENPMTLLRNRGGMLFENGAFPEVKGATGAYPIDLDGDALLDLVILRVGPNTFMRGGEDCQFEPFDFGIPDGGDGWTTAFSATWEGDGRPTLAFGNYVDRDDPDGPFEACDHNVLLRPAGELSWHRTLLRPGFCALSILFSDENRDGDVTLRLSNDRHYYVKNGAEQMWSLAQNRFLGPEDGFDAPSIWGMGIASRDITGDGRPDLALTSMGDQLVLLSTNDGFETAPFSMGLASQRPHSGNDGRPSTGWHAAWGDIDNDGDSDLFYAKGNVDQMPNMAIEDPNSLLLNEDGTFREIAVEAGVDSVERSRGAVLADLDRDGRVDLAVINRRSAMEVWRNVSQTGNAMTLDLRQDGGNSHAIGSWIELRVDGVIQTQEVTIGGGHAGGTALPPHFGLGDALEAEVRITWPDGERTDWTTVPPGPHRVER